MGFHRTTEQGSPPRSQASAPHDVMLYFVLVDYGPKLGRAWAERIPNDMDRKTTIRHIAEGQFGQIVQILECNPVEHICSDVTAELVELARDLDREPHPIMKMHDDAIRAIKEWVEA